MIIDTSSLLAGLKLGLGISISKLMKHMICLVGLITYSNEKQRVTGMTPSIGKTAICRLRWHKVLSLKIAFDLNNERRMSL